MFISSSLVLAFFKNSFHFLLTCILSSNPSILWLFLCGPLPSAFDCSFWYLVFGMSPSLYKIRDTLELQLGNKTYETFNSFPIYISLDFSNCTSAKHCMGIVQIRSYFWSVFSLTAEKYGPEMTLYLDTFHAVKPSISYDAFPGMQLEHKNFVLWHNQFCCSNCVRNNCSFYDFTSW